MDVERAILAPQRCLVMGRVAGFTSDGHSPTPIKVTWHEHQKDTNASTTLEMIEHE